ncbi:MAG: sugar phosphate nucleotidyltransferase [Candidatus Shapirobacteria bacterium]
MRPVIICGGIGSKMWPASRKTLPKHFLPLVKGRSLFEINCQALRKKFSPSQIYVQTNKEQAIIAKKQAPQIPDKNYFIEPEMRNHGPATGFAAAKLFKISPDEPFILIQADLLREPEAAYLQTLGQIERVIKRSGKLVTGGERPKYAVMGIDYLEIGRRAKVAGKAKFFQIKKWIWRDTKEKVKSYFDQRSVLAHWNHFSWTPRLTLEAYTKIKPDWGKPLVKMIAAFGTEKEERVIKREYGKMPSGPVEEVSGHLAEKMYVAELPFSCTDFGTWESVDRYYQKSKRKSKDGNILEINSQNCFVRKEKGKFTALIGVNNLAVVDTPDALLICKKEQSGKVGEVVDFLFEKKKNEFL